MRRKTRLSYKNRKSPCTKLQVQESGNLNTTNAMAVEDEGSNTKSIEFISSEPDPDEYVDDKVNVSETIVNATCIHPDCEDCLRKQHEIFIKEDPIKMEISSDISDTNINTEIKMKDEIEIVNVKTESNSGFLFCDNCEAYYGNYCLTCGMLRHILNNIIDDRTISFEIPRNILEIKISLGHVGIYAQKCIPKGVKFGPFTGLTCSESSLKLKRGKFVVTKDKSKLLNWMCNINPARSISEQNLLAFKSGDELYYRSTCQIQEGEELLVYFGEEYEDKINKNIGMDYIPATEDDIEDVFACTFCCLGFSCKSYLVQHKAACPGEDTDKFSVEELMQCFFCKIYLWRKEYYKHHMVYCCEMDIRKCGNSEATFESRSRQLGVRLQSKGAEIYEYKCSTCQFRAENMFCLYKHVRSMHLKIRDYKCEVCDYRTSYKRCLDMHTKAKHPKEGDYESKASSDNANTKDEPKVDGRKSKQLNALRYQCAYCEHKSKWKANLVIHVKTQHLKEYDFKCEMCKYKTNNKQWFEMHTKTKHLKEFSYICDVCSEFKTNKKENLEIHMKTKHIKKFDYKCNLCNYETNVKANLELHVKTKHLKKFDYKCSSCNYATNQKDYLEVHIKNNHLKEFDFVCEACEFKTNIKACYENHIKSIHLKQFDYVCDSCPYKTNRKYSYENHVKTKHLKKFDYACEQCQFKTNKRINLKVHVKSVHRKEFDYECEMCNFKTNHRPGHVDHILAMHFKDFEVEYKTWENDTKYKDYLDENRCVKAQLLREFVKLRFLNKIN